jgi:MFS family permease
LETGGVRCSCSCPASDHFGSAGIGICGVLPIGTALVTEFAPRRIRATMIVMAVVGVALEGGLAGLVAAQFPPIYGSRARDRPARAAGAPSGPNRSPRVMSPDQAVSNVTWTPPLASAAVRRPRARERVANLPAKTDLRTLAATIKAR